ncbi:hypothetical protein [Thermaurantimonas aggregans]|uniref:hypothetical protein n=1 Tax=Thermaurantimonas aggregans TaxID=2173829 RepID=UPI0023F2693C|nr:hypothetical protein [Thermaurantimonas aggregans]MCX8148756.1 hypothetical protein [Thermaurantimonas aggregans]
MKKLTFYIFSIIILLFLTSGDLIGQSNIRTITFDILKNQLFGGAELPAEEPIKIVGLLPEEVHRVELILYEKSEKNKPYYIGFYQRPFDMKVDRFEIQLDPLRSGRQYFFTFQYFTKATPEQLRALQLSLNANLEAAIRSNYIYRRNSIIGLQSPNQLLKTLNALIAEGLQEFRHTTGRTFDRFSSLVLAKIRQIESESLSNARFNIAKKSKEESQRVAYAEKLIQELIELVQSEATQFLSDNMLILREERTSVAVTEQLPGSIPINFGYGFVYWEGNFSNLVYDTSPYVGISIPLANKTFARYLGNASLSVDVLLRDLEFSQIKYSGPVINLPIYAGLGYKAFRVARFHIGGTLLSSDANSDGQIQLDAALFGGVSIELNVWAGFDKKRKR